MADVIFADCYLSELFTALGIAEKYQDVNIPDEPGLLITALGEHGIEATSAAWNDPGVDWSAHRVCIPKRTWTHTLQSRAFLNWAQKVNQSCDLWNSLAVIEWNLHKRYLIELADRGVPTVPTELMTQGDRRSIQKVANRHGWSDIIIKPAISAGSIGIGHFHPDDSASETHAARLLSAGDILIQPFAPAIQQRGELSLVFFGRSFSHAIRKQPVVGDFRAQPHLGIELVAGDPTEAELAIADMALHAVPDMPQYARIDLIDYDSAPVLMELELIDPYLFLDLVPDGMLRFSRAITQHVNGGQ